MRAYRLAEAAEQDIFSLSEYSIEQFGEAAMERYLQLISIAISELCEDSKRLGVREFAENIKMFHLRNSREAAQFPPGKVGKPRHLIFFREAKDGALEILRVLHEQMDHQRHLDE